jgi:hypothetical protein
MVTTIHSIGEGRRLVAGREEIAAVLDQVRKNAEKQEGGSTKRTVIAELTILGFNIPADGPDARSRRRVMRVITGGAGQPEPPEAA